MGAAAAIAPTLSAAPSTAIQRMPAANAQSVDLGGGTSVAATSAQGGQDTQGGGGAEPASLLFHTTMCPLSKCTFLGSEDATAYYRVESGGLACTVYVTPGRWPDKEANGYLDLLHEAESDPGAICVKFDSDWGDPDCKNPREVHKVWRN